jgi:hypothetical protein
MNFSEQLKTWDKLFESNWKLKTYLDEAIAEEEQHQERMVEVEEVRPINLPEEEPMVAEPEFDDFAEIIHTADCEECNQLSGTYGCTLANKMMIRSKSLNDLDREMADSEDDDYGLKRSKSGKILNFEFFRTLNN